MNKFELHPRLAGDLDFIKDLELSRLLAMPNSELPWCVLVPRIPGLKDLHDLPLAEQQELLKEINHISQKFQAEFNPDKINVAALGNMVPQLHIHIMARFKTDRCWPGATFGSTFDCDQAQYDRFKQFFATF